MYLEKLVIQGFKSFANKNELIFPGGMKDGKHGLTAIVGPNGSGKSNVADAVRWALGEQSMKTLRGKKSEDVIFSGSDHRGQLGMAEVSLHLNNEDGGGNLAYSQVVLTRRLFRDGNSEYLLNGSRVRLLDVQMMLAKANFGQKTYSVIGQGMVENFLNTSLAERKEFFDEATGVKQYQIKREEALNKLRSSIENLGQSQMLIAEIEPRLKALSKQMARLEKKGVMEAELNELQSNYYAKQWQMLADKLATANQAAAMAIADKTECQAAVAIWEKKLEELAGQQTVNEEFDGWQKRLMELRLLSDTNQRRLANLQAWLNLSAATPLSVDEAVVRQAEKQWLEAQRRLTELPTNEADGQRLEELTRALEAAEKSRSDDLRELHRLDAWLEMKLEAAGKYDAAFLTNRRTQLNDQINELSRQLTVWQEELAADQLSADDWSRRKTELLAEAKRLNEEWRQLSTSGFSAEAQEVVSRLQKLIEKLEKAEAAADWATAKTILKDMRAELDETVSYASGQTLKKRLETLSDALSVSAGERAAADQQLSEINLRITSKREQIKLLEKQLASFKQEIQDIERKLVKAQETFDAEAAKAERRLLDERQTASAKLIEDLKTELSALRLDQQAKRLELAEVKRQAEEAERHFYQLTNQIQAEKLLAAKQDAKREELQRLILTSGPINFTSEAVGAEIDSLAAAQATVEAESIEVKRRLDDFNTEQEERRRRLLDAQKTLNQAQQKLSHAEQAVNEQKLQAVRHETRLEDLEQEIKENYDHLSQIKQLKVGDSFDVTAAYDKIKYLKRQLEMIGSIDEEASQEYGNTKERFEFLSGQINDLNKTINSLEEVIKELDVTIRERFDKEFNQIAEKFEEYFRILFNGGTAKIIKVMADDLLAAGEIEEATETVIDQNGPMAMVAKKIKALSKINATGLAGIEIAATPPGKKIKSITMLSGGERALTAIALICAIISANPSPFVVLDEVDAALDEANSERLAKILDDLSEKTQFIVITHNRAPMRRAAILYGVTMQADGVSKLLSVKLEDVKIEGR